MPTTKKAEKKLKTRDLSGMFRGAFSHPEDRRAQRALEKLPGIEWAMKQLGKHSYERIVRLALTAKSVQVGPKSFAPLDAMLSQVCRSLDVARPDLFVRQAPAALAHSTGPDRPIMVLTSGLLDLLDEEEMLCVLAHQVSHVHCGHLWYLMVCDFIRDAADTLGVVGAPLLGPQLALEEWRRRAELSCDRGALLVTGNREAMLRLLGKLAGGGGGRFGAPDAEALLEQEKAFVEGTQGISLGRLYRVIMYLDTQTSFASLRAAELERWAESEGYKALASGNYAAAEASSREERQAPPLWGEFVRRSGSCPVCGRSGVDGEGGACVGHSWMEGVRAAASGAAGFAQQSVSAVSRALDVFFETIQGEGEASYDHGCCDKGVKIPVRGEE